MFVFTGVENHQTGFKDTSTGMQYWVHLVPDDGHVQINGDHATMRVDGKTAVVPITGGPMQWIY